MTIGVFDSGKGGSYIAARLRLLMPEHTFIVADDHTHVPYGTRQKEEILTLTDRALQPLLTQCKIIVIACNTITTAIIDILRARYPDTQFVGLEPMIKPACAITTSRHIITLATPYTLASQRYHQLMREYAQGVTVDEPDTGMWATLIEHGETDKINIDPLETCYAQGADVIILGCTHYLALIPQLQQRMPGVTILEPSEAIARRLRHLLT